MTLSVVRARIMANDLLVNRLAGGAFKGGPALGEQGEPELAVG